MAWPKGKPRKGAAIEPPFSIPATDEGIVMQTETPAPAEKMFAIRLEKNYRPLSEKVEIVGYHKAAVHRKDAAGNQVLVSPAEFVKGEMRPAQYPGVGFEKKIWADTVIKLPEAEARAVQKAKIGALEFDN